MPSYIVCGNCADQKPILSYAEPTQCGRCARYDWVRMITEREPVTRTYLEGALVRHNDGEIDIAKIGNYLHGAVNIEDAVQGYEDFENGRVKVEVP